MIAVAIIDASAGEEQYVCPVASSTLTDGARQSSCHGADTAAQPDCRSHRAAWHSVRYHELLGKSLMRRGDADQDNRAPMAPSAAPKHRQVGCADEQRSGGWGTRPCCA